MKSLRATRAVIYTENLKSNITQVRNYVRKYNKNVKTCIAVKADGYGHNAVVTAKIAQECGVEYLAVASAEEGVELRENGITANILLLSLCTPEEFELLFENDITPLVFGFEYIDLLIKNAEEYNRKNGVSKNHPVFLAVDTGMGRVGCYYYECVEQAERISTSGILTLGGMITHFAVADSTEEENIAFTNDQFAIFKGAIESVREKGIDPGICTCANSAITLDNPQMHLDMVRHGIITYGYYPDDINAEYLKAKNIPVELKPVLSFETKVVAIRKFPAEKSISYGRTWKTSEEIDVAVLPVGYADGLLRRFSPGMTVTINGKNYPVRGRICMDQCMVDLGKDHDVKLFDKAVIFGPAESGALNTAEDFASLGNTISYEILTSITKRVERFVK